MKASNLAITVVALLGALFGWALGQHEDMKRDPEPAPDPDGRPIEVEVVHEITIHYERHDGTRELLTYDVEPHEVVALMQAFQGIEGGSVPALRSRQPGQGYPHTGQRAGRPATRARQSWSSAELDRRQG